MKKLLFLLLFVTTSITAQEIPTVTSFHGVYDKRGNQTVVNFGWYVYGSYDNVISQYIIKRNGVVKKTLQAVNWVQVSIPVERDFKQDNFSLIRIVNGIQSIEYYTTVKK